MAVQLPSRYKQFLMGGTLGIALAIAGVLFESAGAEPFRDLPYVIRDVNGDTLFRTSKFTLLYRGVGGINSTNSFTVAGINRGLSELWNGTAREVTTRSATGLDTLGVYDERRGVASFFVVGQVLRVRNSGSQLQVADISVPLTNVDPPLVIVDRNHKAHVANISETQAVIETIDPAALAYGGESIVPKNKRK